MDTRGGTRHLPSTSQHLLTELGYAPGPIDGLYGGKTRTAIEAFQREKGFEPDGQPTPEILDALRKAL